ncbi:hypothetical protein JCM10450v2_002353 [Rhodotorula kratochvilovae]
MLFHVLDIAVLVAEYLDIGEIARLSRANKALSRALQPSLYRVVELGPNLRKGYVDCTDHVVVQQCRKQLANMLTGDVHKFSFISRLTVVDFHAWIEDSAVQDFRALLDKAEVRNLQIVTCKGDLTETHPVWRALYTRIPTFQRLEELCVVGGDARLPSLDSLATLRSLSLSSLFPVHAIPVFPTGLREFNLSSMWLAANEPFPPSVFGLLEKLFLGTSSFLWLAQVGGAFLTYVGSGATAPLRELSLDPFAAWARTRSEEELRRGIVLSYEDIFVLLQSFASAPLTSLTIGSLDLSLPLRQHISLVLEDPSGLRQMPRATFDIRLVALMVDLITKQFPLLEELVFRFTPTAGGWSDPLEQAQVTRLARLIGRLWHLREFTTNILIRQPEDAPRAAYAGGGSPLSSPTAHAKLSTAHLFFTHIPSLERLTLLDELKCAMPAWAPATGDLNAGDHTSWRKVGTDGEGRAELFEYIVGTDLPDGRRYGHAVRAYTHRLFVSVALAPIPFVIYYYGAHIRRNSKFAPGHKPAAVPVPATTSTASVEEEAAAEMDLAQVEERREEREKERR